MSNLHRFLRFSLFQPLYDFQILVQIYQSIIQSDQTWLTHKSAAKMLSRRCQNSQKSENTQTSEVNSKFFQNSGGNILHHYNCQTLIILVLFTAPFFNFLFSRYLDLTERHFSSDFQVPFPDSTDLYSRQVGVKPQIFTVFSFSQNYVFCWTANDKSVKRA